MTNLIKRACHKSLVSVFLLATTSIGYAFDSGNLYRVNKDFSMHMAVIVDVDNRPLTVDAPGVKNAIAKLFTEDPEFSEEEFAKTSLSGPIHSNSVYFRPTLFLGDQIAMYIDAGLFNDVDAVVYPPVFGGGGGRVTQEIVEDVYLAIYGNAHISMPYEYAITITPGEDYGEYLGDFEGRFLYGSVGTSVTTRLPLESMDILPYAAGEISIVRSSAFINSVSIPSQQLSITNNIDRSQKNIVISQRDMFLLVLGINILRPNMATLRVETKISPNHVSYSLGIGVLF